MNTVLRYKKSLIIIIGILVLIMTLLFVLAFRNNNQQSSSKSTSNDSNSSAVISLDNNNQTSSGIKLNQPTTPQAITSEAYKNPRTDILYEELFRNSDIYIGQYVRYRGKVIQVLGDSGEWNLRVNITKDPLSTSDYEYWKDTVFIYSYSKERVNEDDIIEFTALMNGVITYKSTFGQDITLPSLTIYEHKLVK